MSYSLFRGMWAHSVTVALVFYLKWHLIEVLNLLENVLFKTWRRGTCLSCTVIAWKSPFYEAVRSMEYFYASISMRITLNTAGGSAGPEEEERPPRWVKDSSERAMNFTCRTS